MPLCPYHRPVRDHDADAGPIILTRCPYAPITGQSEITTLMLALAFALSVLYSLDPERDDTLYPDEDLEYPAHKYRWAWLITGYLHTVVTGCNTLAYYKNQWPVDHKLDLYQIKMGGHLDSRCVLGPSTAVLGPCFESSIKKFNPTSYLNIYRTRRR